MELPFKAVIVDGFGDVFPMAKTKDIHEIEIYEVPFDVIPFALDMLKGEVFSGMSKPTGLCVAREVDNQWNAWPCVGLDSNGRERILQFHQQCIETMNPTKKMMGAEIHVNIRGNIIGVAVFFFVNQKSTWNYWIPDGPAAVMTYDELDQIIAKKNGWKDD